MGPKNVEMTAELANGWFPFLFIPERAHDVWGDALAAGAAKRAPDLGPLEVAAGGLVAIGEGLEHLREFARPMTALYVGGMGAKGRNFYNALTRRYGFEAEADAHPGPLPEREEGRGRRGGAGRAPRADLARGPAGLREGAHRRLPRGRGERAERHSRSGPTRWPSSSS